MNHLHRHSRNEQTSLKEHLTDDADRRSDTVGDQCDFKEEFSQGAKTFPNELS
ncbi:MAG: hypothetical protein KDD60_03170 [Bdellovibrionales bacterium]|nr:hypothetical protein [Bdellovibrionales bacterium]